MLGRRARLFADKLLTCAAQIALGESIGIWTGSRRWSGGSKRRIVDAAAALAHACRGVAVHHTGGKGLELGLDRGQRWRYWRDRDGLLRESNRRTFIGRRRLHPYDAKNQNTHGEPGAHADLPPTFFNMKSIESCTELSTHFGSESALLLRSRLVRGGNPIQSNLSRTRQRRRNPTGKINAPWNRKKPPQSSRCRGQLGPLNSQCVVSFETLVAGVRWCSARLGNIMRSDGG